jgi:hypothetical protein
VNNRDWAVVIWLAIAIIFFGRQKEVRSSFGQVLRTVAGPKILVPLLAMPAYIAALVYLGWRLGLWNDELVKDTIIWVIGPAMALFVNSASAGKSEHFFRRAALSTVKYTVLVEFYLNLVVLPLAAELVLVPVVTLVALLTVVAATEDRYRQVHQFLSVTSVVIGLGLLVYVTVRVATDWREFDTLHELQVLALPVWLTVGVLPYIYGLSVYANYETTFMRVDLATENKRSRRNAKLALVTGLRLRVRAVSHFAHPWLHEITGATSFAEARHVVRSFRSSWLEEGGSRK